MRFTRYDVNYFFALLVTGSMLTLWSVAPLIHIALLHAGVGGDSIMWGNILTIVIIFVAIVIAWKKKGALSPVAIVSGCEKRYRVGNIFTGVANITIVLAVLVSILGYFISHEFNLASPFLIAGALLLAVPINIIGIACIETSRHRK
jgi:hypothetical protein